MSSSKAERAYIQTGIRASPPSRADGRTLTDFRPIALETGVAPLANGSARLTIGLEPRGSGRSGGGGGGGTEVLAAVKLEVVDVEECEQDGGPPGGVVCSVTCSPTAYPNLSSPALDDLQHDLSAVLHQTLAHPSLRPLGLGIVPGRKAWRAALDLLVLSDEGNVLDALFMAARAALWDTRVPLTRSVEYRARPASSTAGAGAGMDVDPENQAQEGERSGLDTRKTRTAADFELADYWDEGAPLGGRGAWPVAVTLNLVPPAHHFLDATLLEEAAAPQRLLLAYSFAGERAGEARVQAVRTLGAGELAAAQIAELVEVGEGYAREVYAALNAKLEEEDVRRSQKARDRFAKRQ